MPQIAAPAPVVLCAVVSTLNPRKARIKADLSSESSRKGAYVMYYTDWTKPDYFHPGEDAEPELMERLARELPGYDEAEEE